MARKSLARKSTMIEMAPGERIGSGFNVRPAPYLPIIALDTELDMGIVIKRGTIVTFDNDGYLIPCVGGNTVHPTYAQMDIDMGVIDLDTGTAVLATGAASAAYATNHPVGVAQYDIYQYSAEDLDYYSIQDHVAILEDYLVLYALSSSYTGLDYKPGAAVVADQYGFPIPLSAVAVSDTTTDTLEVQRLTFTAGATAAGTITIGNVNGAGSAVTVELTTAMTTATLVGSAVATAFAANAFWTVANNAGVVSFTAKTYGDKGALTYTDTDDTGVTGAFTTHTAGHSDLLDSANFLINAVNNKVGKVIRKINLANPVDTNFMGGYEKVIVVPGLNLASGTVTGIDADTKQGVLIQLQF